MACPYFIPTVKCDGDLWPHPSRLPLGAGFEGECAASAGSPPGIDALKQFCNLGYAHGCSRLPADRAADAVRIFARHRDGLVSLTVVSELAHHPVTHHELAYDPNARAWVTQHEEERAQRLAACYLETFLASNPTPPRIR